MIVTAVAADGVTLTVVRGWGGTTAATAADNATIRRVGIAAPEGKDADGPIIWGNLDLFNRTQILEDVVEMSGTEEESFILGLTQLPLRWRQGCSADESDTAGWPRG